MLENFLVLIIFAGFGLSFYFYLYLPDQKRKARKQNKEIIPPKNKMQELDFFGMNRMQADPHNFLQELERKKNKMENGEEIAVDAMEAFYLIRNSKHHGMIVSEDGKINFKKIQTQEDYDAIAKRVMAFEKKGSKKSLASQIPGYVDHVEQLQCGGVRWVFTKEHAEACGNSSICYDQHNRSMPDPDEVKVDPKKQKRDEDNSLVVKAANEAKEEARRATQLLTELALQKELEKHTAPVDENEINGVGEIENELGEIDFEKVMSTNKSDTTHFLEQNSFENKNYSSSTNDDVEDQDFDFAASPEEIEVPDFFKVMDVVPDAVEVNDLEDEQDEDVALDQTVEFENFELLCDYFIHHSNLFDSLLLKLFSKNGEGNVFVDFEHSFAYVQKNYFMQTLQSFITTSSALSFQNYFLVEGTVQIFDGLKVNALIQKIDSQKICEGFHSKKSDTNFLYLWNILFQSNDVADVFFEGWFLKINFHNVSNITSWIDHHSRGADVSILANKPKEIERKMRGIKNIRSFQ